MKRKTRYWILAAMIIAVLFVPAYVRLYRVAGSSDAPTYLPGDRVLVNKAAFDIRLPYTNIVILSHSDPEPGDVVMFREPGAEDDVFKRVMACPGDSIAMHDNHLTINGVALQYTPVNARVDEATEPHLGSVVAYELGHGRGHTISYTPGASGHGSFGPIKVPAGQYFLIGDNRDNSRDSRVYGTVSRRLIIGRVSRPYGRACAMPAATETT